MSDTMTFQNIDLSSWDTLYKKRDSEIKINVLFTDNMGDKADPNTSITMTAYCIKKQFFHHFWGLSGGILWMQ